MKDFKLQIYLIADFSYGLAKIERALQGGVDFLQLREKNISSALYLERAIELRKMASYYHVPYVINDRMDIALLSQADGVHLGQEDVPIRMARAFMGEKALLGATAKTVEQAVKAQQEGADYLGSGAWFPTKTKPDAKLIDPAVYKNIREATTIPHVAVGGITADNCQVPIQCGADGIAVSSGILASDHPEKVIEKYRQAFIR